MEESDRTYRAVILGAGFGGLGMGAQMKRAGEDDFVIFERADRIGGVWRDNDYPGAACDTEAHLYCYSFFPHLRVSRMYAARKEHLGYMDRLVDHFDMKRHIRFDTEVRSAQWDQETNLWRFTLSDGSNAASEFFLPAWGQLNRPYTPGFAGIESFAGVQFHSAQWNHAVSLKGKRVASVGNAASAVQYVPEVAIEATQLTVFQRSANWIMPRNQIVFSEEQLDAFEANPSLYEDSRKHLHAFRESGFERTRHSTNAQTEGIAVALAHLKTQVPDPVLRAKLTPDYEFACKRILKSDDYFPTLMRDNVELETSPIERFVPEGIVTRDGVLHRFDVVIFGTGFESQAFQGDLRIAGVDGQRLDTVWSDGAEAYLGMVVPGFPNMFMIYGPNTNLNHNSVMTMLEIQQSYILDAIKVVGLRGEAADVQASVFREYNVDLQARMKGSAFSSGCSSWYKNAAGKVINNWPSTVDEYRRLARWASTDYDWSAGRVRQTA